MPECSTCAVDCLMNRLPRSSTAALHTTDAKQQGDHEMEEDGDAVVYRCHLQNTCCMQDSRLTWPESQNSSCSAATKD